jgi:hypothetical protein
MMNKLILCFFLCQMGNIYFFFCFNIPGTFKIYIIFFITQILKQWMKENGVEGKRNEVNFFVFFCCGYCFLLFNKGMAEHKVKIY